MPLTAQHSVSIRDVIQNSRLHVRGVICASDSGTVVCGGRSADTAGVGACTPLQHVTTLPVLLCCGFCADRAREQLC